MSGDKKRTYACACAAAGEGRHTPGQRKYTRLLFPPRGGNASARGRHDAVPRHSLLKTALAAGAMLAAAPAWAQSEAGVDPGTLPAAWNPYIAGALIGLLVCLTMLISGRPLGASGAYAKVTGLILRMISPRHVDRQPYYHENKPKIDWEVTLVLGAVLGAFLAAWTGGEITGRWLPPMWVEHFGTSLWLRLIVGFAGGAAMSYGARLAGGCTSGHGISGALHLSVGSWIALACFFIGGVTTAFLLYGG